MKKNFLMMAFVCLFTVVAISSCDKDKEDKKDPVEVTGVTLNKAELTLNVGSSETLTATVEPDDADNKTVTWTTSDSTKVKVTVNGLVTAVAKGSSTVTATAGSKSDECTVTVTNDTIITAIVENGSSLNGKVDTVKAESEYEKSNEDWDYYLFASAPYSNGGFTLKLPKDVSDLYLSALSEAEFPDSITVSNRNVKVGQVDLSAYMSNYQTGAFYHGTIDWFSVLMYANGDVSITGSHTYTETYDLDGDDLPETYTYIEKDNVHLKKGWNMVYMRETVKENNTYEDEVTTTVPSDAKWYFIDSYEDYEVHEDSFNSVSSQITKVPFLSKSKGKKR